MKQFDTALFVQAMTGHILDIDYQTPVVEAHPITAALLGTDTSPVGYTLQAQQFYQRLIHRSTRESDVSTISQIVGGVAIADRIPVQWLHEVTSVFRPADDVHWSEADQERVSFHFPFGVILGLFQAAVWRDKYAVPEKFDEAFPEAVASIILSSAPFIPHGERYEQYCPRPALYSEPLQKAISTWVSSKLPPMRPSEYAYVLKLNTDGVHAGLRIHQAIALVTQVVMHLHKHPEQKLTEFGSFILDRINYALFSGFSSQGRSETLCRMFDSMVIEPTQAK